MLDGTTLGRHPLVVALGIDREERKHVLGVVEGTTESAAVCRGLLRTLRSTNPIENLQDRIKDVARNVKRWRNGSMVLRWAVTGLMEAETRFRRIRGYRDLDQLEIGLERLIEDPLDKEALVA